MNNLFFNPNENWFLWLIVGFFSAAIVFLIANNTQESGYVLAVNIGIFIMLTFYMSYTRRFTFIRALKISVMIFSSALAPMLFFSFEQIKLFGNADFIIRFFVLSLFVVISSLACSLIVRKPKDYF